MAQHTALSLPHPHPHLPASPHRLSISLLLTLRYKDHPILGRLDGCQERLRVVVDAVPDSPKRLNAGGDRQLGDGRLSTPIAYATGGTEAIAELRCQTKVRSTLEPPKDDD